MKRPLILAAAGLAFGASAALAITRPIAQDAAPAAPAAPGDAAHGKQLFVAIGCYQCHGYVGQGSQSTGPALTPLRLSDEGFVKYLRNPRGVMPAFSAKLLPAADARDVLAYVRSLTPGAPPDRIALLAPYVVHGAAPRAPVAAAASSAPIDTAAGGKLFAANCAACHGATLDGGMGPKLRGTSLTADQIAAIILNPPPPMPKLSPAPLSTQQVRQVAAFVHAQK
jgi:ubiquinol-cytochrome c reductase cytochrome c subunit